MIKNVTIFFFSGIILLGVIAGSAYGFARIVDAANYNAKIPEVRIIESTQIQNETPTLTPFPRIIVTPVQAVKESPAKPEPTQQAKVIIPSSTKKTDFEKDNDKEDMHEGDNEKR